MDYRKYISLLPISLLILLGTLRAKALSLIPVNKEITLTDSDGLIGVGADGERNP